MAATVGDLLNEENLRTGSDALLSRITNNTSMTAQRSRIPAEAGENPCAGIDSMTYSPATIATNRRADPVQSKPERSNSPSLGTAFAARNAPATPIGTLNRNIQPQSSDSVSTPPSTGPRAPPTEYPRTEMESPRAVRPFGRCFTAIIMPDAESIPPPTPWSALNASIIQKESEKAHRRDPIPKTANPPTMTALSAPRSLILPNIRMRPAIIRK